MGFGRGNDLSHKGISSLTEGLVSVPRLTTLDLRQAPLRALTQDPQVTQNDAGSESVRTAAPSYNTPGVEGASALARGLRHVSGLLNLQLWLAPAPSSSTLAWLSTNNVFQQYISTILSRI